MGNNQHGKGSGAQDVNYYAVLNVPRTATHNEIRKAYYYISRRCHPDKQRRNLGNNVNEYNLRTQEFALVNEAWNVLGDPYKREVYDQFGFPGVGVYLSSLNKDLETTEINENKGLTIYDTPVNRLKQRIASSMAEVEAVKYYNHLKANCAIMIDVNANSFFFPPNGFNEYVTSSGILPHQQLLERFDLLESSSIVFQQSVSADLSNTETLTIGGYCVTRDGLGYGDVKLTLDSNLDSDTHLRVATSFGHETSLMCELGRDVTEDDNLSVSWKCKRGDINPSPVNLSYKRQLDGDRAVVVTLSDMFNRIRNSLGLSYETKDGNKKWDYNITFSPTDIDGGAGYKHTSADGKTTHKMSIQTQGGHGFGVEFGRTVPLSDRSMLSSTIGFGITGVKLNLRYARGFMRLVVPITFSKISFIGKMLSFWVHPDGDSMLDFDWNDISYDIWGTVSLFAFSAILERGFLQRKKQRRRIKASSDVPKTWPMNVRRLMCSNAW